MDGRTLDAAPLGGGTKTFWFDDVDDTFTIEHKVDLQPFVDQTQRMYNEEPDTWSGDFHHVASIPFVLLPELAKKGIMSAGGRILDRVALKRWLNDSDNRAFRTRPGIV